MLNSSSHLFRRLWTVAFERPEIAANSSAQFSASGVSIERHAAATLSSSCSSL